MNLKELYQDAKVTYVSGGGYDTTQKERFGRRAVLFLRRACKLANIQPDKRYPHFNKGGPAVLGEVYLTITKADQSSRIEFIFGERCALKLEPCIEQTAVSSGITLAQIFGSKKTRQKRASPKSLGTIWLLIQSFHSLEIHEKILLKFLKNPVNNRPFF